MSSINEAEFLKSALENDVLRPLLNDLRAGRMPHALLLTGEEGIGKKTAARYFANALMCTSADPLTRPCGQCRNCQRFAARTHPDVFFPEPAPKEKTIKVDTLRGLIDTLSRHPLEGGRRMVVLENAERMTPQAQNCLLKTLEETDEATYFLLTADLETAILPTIRSRCRIVRMRPWPPQRLEQALTARGIPEHRAYELVQLSEGSLGKALHMQEDDSYWELRSLVQRSFMSARSTREQTEAANLLKDQKDNGDRVLDILEQELLSLLHAFTAGQKPDCDGLPSFWKNATPQRIARVLEAVLFARRRKKANVGWAAVSETCIQTISEEINKW